MKKLLFIINPVTARAAVTPSIIDIIDLFEKNGYEVTVHISKAKGEVTDYVRENAEGYDVVVSAGGDGTLSETVSGVVDLEKRPVLGYLPSGTTNDFAISWGIPRKPLEAAEKIACGEPNECDISTFCGKPFVYVAAFGAFTEASYSTPQELKKSLGWAAYIIEGLKSLPTIHPIKMKIEHDGGTLEGEFYYGMISNTKHVGGFELKISEGVSLSDGMMELILIHCPKTQIDNTRLITALLAQDTSSEYITFVHTKKVKFESEEEMAWTIDGERGELISAGEAEVIDGTFKLYY